MDTEANSGGKGGDLNPLEQTSDTRLIERAIRERWLIPAEGREKLPAEMLKVALNKRASFRNKSVAARVLVMMDKLNLQEEKRDDVPKLPEGDHALTASERAALDHFLAGLVRRFTQAQAAGPGNGNGQAALPSPTLDGEGEPDR